MVAPRMSAERDSQAVAGRPLPGVSLGVFVCAGALVLGAPARLSAQPIRPPSDAGVTVDGGAPETPQRRADALFQAATEAWNRGDYPAAARGFTEAYEALPHPWTLYNLGRALESGGEVARAVEVYTRYLREAPDAPDRAEVQGRLETLRRRPVEVFLTSEPLDAAVRVDDETVASARTPCRLQLTPGAHVVVLDRQGYRQRVERVVVEAGVARDLRVPLEALSTGGEGPRAPTANERVLARRRSRWVSWRLALIGGFAVPRDRPTLALGLEGGLFVRRSFSVQVNAFWIDTDGSPFSIVGDIGWVFVIDEIDLGLFVHGGALLQCDTSCRESTFRRDSEQFIGGFTVRAEVLLHPHVGIGLFGRASWRNFDFTSEGLLASGGLSVGMHF